MIIPLYKWGYWHTEKLTNISKVPQLGNDKAGIQSLVLQELHSSVMRPASMHSISTLGLYSPFWSTQPSTSRNISKWATSSSVGFPSQRLDQSLEGGESHLVVRQGIWEWGPQFSMGALHWTSPAFWYFMSWMHQHIRCLLYSLKIFLNLHV